MKKLWELAYSEFLETQDDRSAYALRIASLNGSIDTQLQELLPEGVFEAIFTRMSELQAMIECRAFEAGFRWGLQVD